MLLSDLAGKEIINLFDGAKLGLVGGEPLDLRVGGDRLIVTRYEDPSIPRPKVTLTTNPVTGLPVLSVPPGSPMIGMEQVHALLEYDP